MYIIAGLGNPGKQYENTKHNVGFLTIDVLAEKLGIRVSKIKHKALTGEGFISGEKVILVKPQTYMNLSGESIREILSFYKADPERLVVIYDDIDLPMGSLRIRRKGQRRHAQWHEVDYLPDRIRGFSTGAHRDRRRT